MHDGEAGIGEALVYLDHALDALGGELLCVVHTIRFAHGVAHHADQLGTEALHAGDGAADFGLGNGKVVGDLFGPVADERAETAHFHAFLVETGHDLVEDRIGDLVQIAFHAIDLDAAGFDAIPAELLVGLDLHFEGRACFICNAGEFDHGRGG